MPRVSAHVANEWRSRCGCTRFLMPAVTGSAWRSWLTPDAVSASNVPSGLRRSASNRRSELVSSGLLRSA
jgi:hypothetical protein